MNPTWVSTHVGNKTIRGFFSPITTVLPSFVDNRKAISTDRKSDFSHLSMPEEKTRYLNFSPLQVISQSLS
ncbi:MAG: hypothetical protein ACOX2I_02845 [Candidatus Ozemobacteraceae bacterium]